MDSHEELLHFKIYYYTADILIILKQYRQGKDEALYKGMACGLTVDSPKQFNHYENKLGQLKCY